MRSWVISNGGVVIPIGRKFWLQQFWLQQIDRAAAAAFNPKQLTNVVHKIN
ncbi:hypothetical protein SynA1560_01970 [Synechococcus sp. A15-60]|nr:hypothetical protein SynA1560_01970 [Synechococcus sp. A15-60]